MPFLLSFFLTLSAVMWFFYGLLRKDYNIAVSSYKIYNLIRCMKYTIFNCIYMQIPNVLGFSFGVTQMVLYVIYKGAKAVVKEKLPDELIQQLPEIKDQIIDVVALTALVCPDPHPHPHKCASSSTWSQFPNSPHQLLINSSVSLLSNYVNIISLITIYMVMFNAQGNSNYDLSENNIYIMEGWSSFSKNLFLSVYIKENKDEPTLSMLTSYTNDIHYRWWFRSAKFLFVIILMN